MFSNLLDAAYRSPRLSPLVPGSRGRVIRTARGPVVIGGAQASRFWQRRGWHRSGRRSRGRRFILGVRLSPAPSFLDVSTDWRPSSARPLRGARRERGLTRQECAVSPCFPWRAPLLAHHLWPPVPTARKSFIITPFRASQPHSSVRFGGTVRFVIVSAR